MIHWPVRQLVNTVYAYRVEQAMADDRAETAMWGHVSDESRANLCKNRDELEATLSAPMGRQAAAEQALIRELGGG